MGKRKVTLIGDDHRDSTHMDRVRDYLTKKLNKEKNVFLALEEVVDPDNKSFPLRLRTNSPEPRRGAKTTAEKMSNLSMVHDSGKEYKRIFESLLKDIKRAQSPQELYIAPVDYYSDKGKDDFTSIKRDRAMYNNIIQGIKDSKSNQVIYPVGSGHIFDTKSADKRLASLLQNDSKNNIALKLKNFYPQNTDAYNEVQKDIDNFYKHHQIPEEKKVINQPRQQLGLQGNSPQQLSMLGKRKRAGVDVDPVTITLERIKAGLAAARARGTNGGRKFRLSKAQVRLAEVAMKNRDTSVGDLCKELKITRNTLYQYVSPTGELRERAIKRLKL